MACKITKRTEHREITLEEFKKQKTINPYKTFRQDSKSLNFLMAFGGSESVLSQSALEAEWTDERIEEFLRDNDCTADLEKVSKKYSKEPPERQKYIAVANYMRDRFFQGYPQLLERCLREVAYAEKHGYCRSFFGATRNFIELRLKGSWDEKNLSASLRNESNIARNFRAQNYEACVRGRAMRETQQWLKSRGYKTRVWNEIHDSVDLWLHRDELQEGLPHMKHVFERKIPELEKNWVPLIIDCEISDLNKGDYYKAGQAPEAFDVSWDDKTKYRDVDPFNVELADRYEIEYFQGRRDYWNSLGKEDPLKDQISEYLKTKGLSLDRI